MEAVILVAKSVLLIAIAGVGFAALTAGVGGMSQVQGVQLCTAPATQMCIFSIL